MLRRRSDSGNVTNSTAGDRQQQPQQENKPMASNTNTNTTTEKIIVADPPPRRRLGGGRTGKWQKKLEQIQSEHPNQFCIFAQGVKSAAYFYAFSAKHDNVELTTRQTEDGTFDVYVKVNV